MDTSWPLTASFGQSNERTCDLSPSSSQPDESFRHAPFGPGRGFPLGAGSERFASVIAPANQRHPTVVLAAALRADRVDAKTLGVAGAVVIRTATGHPASLAPDVERYRRQARGYSCTQKDFHGRQCP